MRGIFLSVFLLYFCGPCHIRATYSYTLENDLRTKMYTTNSYQLLSRPDATVNVNITVRPISLSGLDLKSQTMTMTGYFTFLWEDPRLDWATDATYNSIPYIFSTSDYTWRPTLIIANSEIGVSIIDDDTNMMRVIKDGTIDWTQAMYTITGCTMDVTFYPFDTQVCSLEITSWSYTDGEVDFDFNDPDVDMSFYAQNGEWEYVKYKASITTVSRGFASHPMAIVEFSFRRRPAFLVTSIILPVIAIAFLSSFIFTLHPDSGEKVGFCLTVMLAYAVYLTLVADHMPTTSTSTSVLNVYNLVILFASIGSIPITLFVLYCNHRPEDEPIPKWVRKCTLRFNRTLNICCSSKEKNEVRVIVMTPIDKKENTMVDEPRNEEDLDWKKVCKIWDMFFFRVYIAFDIISTSIMILSLIIGYCIYYNPSS